MKDSPGSRQKETNDPPVRENFDEETRLRGGEMTWAVSASAARFSVISLVW